MGECLCEEVGRVVERVWREAEKNCEESRGPLESEVWRVRMAMSEVGKVCLKHSAEFAAMSYEYDQVEAPRSTTALSELQRVMVSLAEFVELCAKDRVKSLLGARKLSQKVMTEVSELKDLCQILSCDSYSSQELRSDLREARRNLSEIRSTMHEIYMPLSINKAIRTASISLLIKALIDIGVAEDSEDAERHLRFFCVYKQEDFLPETTRTEKKIETVGSLFSNGNDPNKYKIDASSAADDDGSSESSFFSSGSEISRSSTQLKEDAIFNLYSSSANNYLGKHKTTTPTVAATDTKSEASTVRLQRSTLVDDLVDELVASGAEQEAAQIQISTLCTKLMAQANANTLSSGNTSCSTSDYSSTDTESLPRQQGDGFMDESGSSISARISQRKAALATKNKDMSSHTPEKSSTKKTVPRPSDVDASPLTPPLSGATRNSYSTRTISTRKTPLRQNHSAPLTTKNNGRSRRNSPPPLFICPLTRVVMTNPVRILTPSPGLSFERDALIAWLKLHPQQDPITRKPTHIPITYETNHDLAQRIDEWRHPPKPASFIKRHMQSTGKKTNKFRPTSVPSPPPTTQPEYSPPRSPVLEVRSNTNTTQRRRIPSIRTWTADQTKDNDQRTLKSWLTAATSKFINVSTASGDGDDDDDDGLPHAENGRMDLVYY